MQPPRQYRSDLPVVDILCELRDAVGQQTVFWLPSGHVVTATGSERCRKLMQHYPEYWVGNYKSRVTAAQLREDFLALENELRKTA